MYPYHKKTKRDGLVMSDLQRQLDEIQLCMARVLLKKAEHEELEAKARAEKEELILRATLNAYKKDYSDLLSS